LTSASTIGIALNTSHLNESEARNAIRDLEDETGYPVQDIVRFGAQKLASLITE